MFLTEISELKQSIVGKRWYHMFPLLSVHNVYLLMVFLIVKSLFGLYRKSKVRNVMKWNLLLCWLSVKILRSVISNDLVDCDWRCRQLFIELGKFIDICRVDYTMNLSKNNCLNQ